MSVFRPSTEKTFFLKVRKHFHFMEKLVILTVLNESFMFFKPLSFISVQVGGWLCFA